MGLSKLPSPGSRLQNAGETARGFFGIAFTTSLDASKREFLYLRPTNGRANDQLCRNRSSQYISIPGYPWEKLSKEALGQYGFYVDIVPAEWIKIKIVGRDEVAGLCVSDVSQPPLIVNDLKQGKSMRGSIRLWIGQGTLGISPILR